MIYLIEPYNAYQKPPKKRHWTEVAEEEALFYRIMEQQRLMIAEKSALQNNQNLALISQQSPPPSQQVQDASAGVASGNSGGGGTPTNIFQDLGEVAAFTISPTSGVGPLSVSFTNTTLTPDDDLFTWDFGDSSSYSTAENPTPHTYQTGSFTIILRETSSVGRTSTASTTLVVSAPTLTAGFSVTTSSNSAPSSASFTNSVVYNGSGTLTYLWQYGSGSLTSTAATAAPIIYTRSGSYTASLQVTESSYNIKSSATVMWRLT